MSATTRPPCWSQGPATIDRRLQGAKVLARFAARSHTKPGSLLKSQIPIRTWSEWDEDQPGFVEVDLVPEAAWPLFAAAALLWAPALAHDPTTETVLSLGLMLVSAWWICRPLVRATGTGVEVRSVWRSRLYAWDEIDEFSPDKTGVHLVMLTRRGKAVDLPATFSRSLTKRGRSRALDEWVGRLETVRPKMPRLI